MKIRVFIHKELADTAGELRHFIIRVPNDCRQITAIDISMRQVDIYGAKRKYQYGKLRIERRGHVLLDERVLREGYRLNVEKTFVPEISPLRAVCDGRRLPVMIHIDGSATILEGKLQVEQSVDSFELILTFYYTSKS